MLKDTNTTMTTRFMWTKRYIERSEHIYLERGLKPGPVHIISWLNLFGLID
jgi:hypothetical protein